MYPSQTDFVLTGSLVSLTAGVLCIAEIIGQSQTSTSLQKLLGDIEGELHLKMNSEPEEVRAGRSQMSSGRCACGHLDASEEDVLILSCLL